VPLDPADVPALRRHRLASGRPSDGALVFAEEHGDPLDAGGSVRRAWARMVAAARIDDEPLAAPLPRLHDARHAWAVAMLRSGIAPAALARLGGWADVGIIHRRYGRRALPDELDGAGRALGAWRASRRLERAAQALAYRVDRPTLHETVIAYGEIHRLALLLEPTGGAGGHSPSSPTGEEIAAAMRQSEFPPRDMFGPWARGEKDPPVVRFLRWIGRSSVTH
jgi:Phage integrase family